MEIEPNLTTSEYILFKLSYPFVDTTTLIKIKPTVKRPGVIQLMDINDYQTYVTQQNELNAYVDKMTDIKHVKIPANRDNATLCCEYIGLFNGYIETRAKHTSINTYYLSPGQLFWNKMDANMGLL
jgi:hypothetical protein